MPKSDWAVHSPDRATNSECGAPGYAPKPCGATSPGLLRGTIDKNYMSMPAFKRRNSWERTFIGRHGAALYEASARSRGCFQSGTAMPPRVCDKPRPRCVQCPWLPPFLGRFPKVRFLNSREAKGGGEGGGGADEGKRRSVQAMGRSWKDRPRLCGDPPLSLMAGPELGGARSSGRVSSARRSWCGYSLFPFT